MDQSYINRINPDTAKNNYKTQFIILRIPLDARHLYP